MLQRQSIKIPQKHLEGQKKRSEPKKFFHIENSATTLNKDTKEALEDQQKKKT
jgi:hypothetical protein